MANVVVIGAGLGGLPTAYEMRRLLPRRHTVTLVSDKLQFTFIPGLIRVALNLNPLEHIQLNVERLAQKQGIEWVFGKVSSLDPDAKRITVEGGQTIDYDFVAIATGASLAFDNIPGLGPRGYTHSVCTPEHALQARDAWVKFLENPGPLVVGAAPGTGCFGPAYEFVLMADWELRRRGLRHRVSITYVTPEPYIGHMGVGGVRNARELTASLMQKRGIEVIDNAAIAAINASSIRLSDERQIPFQYSMILPPFRGVEFIRQAPGLGNERGFISVSPTYQHPKFPSIYALGISVQLNQPEETAVPIGLPKSGEMAEAMGLAVAHNIAVELGAIQAPFKSPTLEALCFAEFGNTGIAYIAVPVIPDPTTGKRRSAYALQGRWVTWVKAAFEEYFMLKMRLGVGVPWFEQLGLRTLFGLSLIKPLPLTQEKQIASAPPPSI